MLQKIIEFLRYRVFTKKSWRWPSQSDVLIYDACGQEYLLNYLAPWQPITLHVRGELMNMPVILASLFRSGKKSHAYVDCYIEKVKPKLIVTFIDNNPNFYLLSNRHPNIKTMFLQNGWRGYYADSFELLRNMESELIEKMKVDYMMTFGALTGEMYAKYFPGTALPIGSIKNNYLANKNNKEKDLIVFISQWCKDGFIMGSKFYTHWEFFGQADNPILKWIKKYADVNNKKLVIAPRFFEDLDLRLLEEAYYEGILGDDVEYLKLDKTYPAYQAIDMASVVITVDSTLGYESIARGNKTAFFSIRSDLLGIPGFTCGWPDGLPDEGYFWSNYLNTDNFTRIMDYLFSVSDEQWQKDLDAVGFSSLMLYDSGNTIFNSVLKKELGTAPS